jgi:adenylate kinase
VVALAPLAQALMIALIFGPPGSGKGTQARLIQAEFKLIHLSTGDILRAEVRRGSKVGREVRRIMTAGDLVPDELIVKIVQRQLEKGSFREGVLLDGFPRTVAQALALDEILSRRGLRVDVVIALDAPEDVLVDRLVERAREQGRSDDTLEAIRERMHEYREHSMPVLDHYRRQGVRVLDVDATGGVDEVFERIKRALKAS